MAGMSSSATGGTAKNEQQIAITPTTSTAGASFNFGGNVGSDSPWGQTATPVSFAPASWPGAMLYWIAGAVAVAIGIIFFIRRR